MNAFPSSARRPVLQTTAAECGLACLATICRHHGLDIELHELRQRFALSLRGATLSDLMEIATALGFNSRPLRLELDEIGQLARPCILHWDLNHFVVLIRADRKRIIIQDPARGEVSISYLEASPHFTGIALELSPSQQFVPRHKSSSVGWLRLMGPVTGLKGGIAQMLLLATALQIFALTAPLGMQWIIDGAVVSGDGDLLWILVIGYLMLMLIQPVITFGRGVAGIALSTQLGLQWSHRVFVHLIRLPMRYFETRHTGDIVSRFQSLHAIQRTITGPLVEAMLDGIFAVMTAMLMLLYSPVLACIAFAALALYAALRLAGYQKLMRVNAEQLMWEAKEQTHFLESIRGVQSIKLSGLEEKRGARWINLLLAAVNRHAHVEKLTLGFRCMYMALFGIEAAAVLGLAASMAIHTQISVGMLLAFLAYKDQFSERMQGFIDHAISLRMLRLQVERLSDIVLTPLEKTSSGQPMRLDISDVAPPSIELQNVSYRYGDGEPWVLRHVNLKIDAGQHVAVVGPSGCGKSTLAKILLGLIEPTEGHVIVGGVPLKHMGLENWRRYLGVVMQEDQLFSGPLVDNITNFADTADLARVQAVAELAAIHNDIMQMPMGYHSLVGDMGSSLSGGQKQRVLLARALYRQPKVLVLDEATSHLDVAKERQVNESIRRLDLTRIVFAHRLETIAMADRVVDLDAMHANAFVVETERAAA